MPIKKRSNPYLNGCAMILMGIAVGILSGLSISPVIGDVIGALLAIIAGLTAIISGVRQAEKQIEGESVDSQKKLEEKIKKVKSIFNSQEIDLKDDLDKSLANLKEIENNLKAKSTKGIFSIVSFFSNKEQQQANLEAINSKIDDIITSLSQIDQEKKVILNKIKNDLVVFSTIEEEANSSLGYVNPWPVALLFIGITGGAIIGILFRTHNCFGVDDNRIVISSFDDYERILKSTLVDTNETLKLKIKNSLTNSKIEIIISEAPSLPPKKKVSSDRIKLNSLEDLEKILMNDSISPILWSKIKQQLMKSNLEIDVNGCSNCNSTLPFVEKSEEKKDRLREKKKNKEVKTKDVDQITKTFLKSAKITNTKLCDRFKRNFKPSDQVYLEDIIITSHPNSISDIKAHQDSFKVFKDLVKNKKLEHKLMVDWLKKACLSK